MTASLRVLDLSGYSPSKQALALAKDVFFDASPQPLASKADLQTTDPLILYIVGHAFPDALVAPALQSLMQDGQTTGNGKGIVRESSFASFLKEQRGRNPTLIIWDICFAKSFAQINGNEWGDFPYVHIFACEKYEQTWHSGDTSDPPRQTLLSMALQGATARGAFENWAELQQRLEDRLPLQRPSIDHNGLDPAVFGLPKPLTIKDQGIFDLLFQVVVAVASMVASVVAKPFRAMGLSSVR